MTRDLKPLYRYVGGKSRSIKHISKYLKYANTYVEPFFGGGAVFCHIYNLGLAKNFVINDIRAELIGIYRAILENHVLFCDEVSDLCDRYNSLSVGQKETMFYEIRDSVYEKYDAAHYMFILTCNFTGLPNIKSEGRYTVLSGHNKFANTKRSIDREQILMWRAALEKSVIYRGDFQSVPMKYDDALMFVDPPYHKATVDYGQFTRDDQIRCFKWCSTIACNKHITVLLSNSDYKRFFSNMCTDDMEELHYDARYSSGASNVRKRESLFIWNKR